MVTLVIGGSNSGKSSVAEELLMELSDVKAKYYLATMEICDEAGKMRVEKHRKLRQGKGFITMEHTKDIDRAAEKMKPEDRAVLLECMSNLTANELFGEQILSADEVAEKIFRDICRLKEKVKHLIIVTNSIFEEEMFYDKETITYMTALEKVNRRLVIMADRVVEVTNYVPVFLKGKREE